MVTGAAGFIGRRLTQTLVDLGYHVVAFVHRNSVPRSEAVSVFTGDLRDKASIINALEGVTSVIHLGAAKADERASHAINVDGTANLVAACRGIGTRRLIYVSTQADPRGVYGRTKYEGEGVVLESGLDLTILQPNLIYGGDKTGAFAKVVDSVRKMPLIPITGPARGWFWPIHVDDCCDAIAACLTTESAIGQTIVLQGPDSTTLPELLISVGNRVGKQPRMVHLPMWLSLAMARVCRALLSNPPLTVSNVLGCNQRGVKNDIAAMIEILEVTPRPLAQGLDEVMADLESAE